MKIFVYTTTRLLGKALLFGVAARSWCFDFLPFVGSVRAYSTQHVVVLVAHWLLPMLAQDNLPSCVRKHQPLLPAENRDCSVRTCGSRESLSVPSTDAVNNVHGLYVMEVFCAMFLWDLSSHNRPDGPRRLAPAFSRRFAVEVGYFLVLDATTCLWVLKYTLIASGGQGAHRATAPTTLALPKTLACHAQRASACARVPRYSAQTCGGTRLLAEKLASPRTLCSLLNLPRCVPRVRVVHWGPDGHPVNGHPPTGLVVWNFYRLLWIGYAQDCLDVRRVLPIQNTGVQQQDQLPGLAYVLVVV